MIKHNNNSFSSVYDETTVIGKIMKGTLKVYEAWKKLIASGVPPLTLLKCKPKSMSKRLPDEYKEIEYIESTGEQYINVGYIPKANDVYKIKFLHTSIAGNQVIFGSRTSGTYKDSLNQVYLNKTSATATPDDLLFFSGTTSKNFSLTQINKRYDLELSVNDGNFDNNSNQPLYLFTFNNMGSVTAFANIKLYKFEITNNNTIIRDLVPCYRKSDNVLGMYDLVENKFYTNDGTGEFLKGNNTLGEDLVDYKVYGNSEQKKVPNEYEQVGYIEATGTQYLELDYIASNITNSKGFFQLTNTSSALMLFGSRTDGSSNGYALNWGGGRNPCVYFNTYYSGGTAGLTATEVSAEKTLFEKRGATLLINNKPIHTHSEVPEFKARYNMIVFGCNSGGTIGYFTKGRIFNLQFYDNDELKVDLIPCYRKSDNEIGMYDTVTGTFYTNKGTGTFLMGGNATPTPEFPIEIESVGEPILPSEYQEVEYIESTGTQYINTNYTDVSDTRVELDFVYTGILSTSSNYMGANGGNVLAVSANGRFSINACATGITPTVGERYKISSYRGVDDMRSATINGVEYIGTKASRNEIYHIFTLGGQPHTTQRIYGKLYSCKIYYQGKIVRDFIPCYRKSDNVIGVYDVVNDVFYTNAGTGKFLKGNDILKRCKIPVKVSKENLLKLNDGFVGGTYLEYTCKNGIVTKHCNSYVQTSYLLQIDAFDAFIGTSKLKAGTYFWNLYNVSGVAITNPYIVLETSTEKINWNVNTSITLTEEATIIQIRSASIGYGKGETQQFGIEIQEGDTFVEPITTNIYLNEPLRKIGDYADYVDFVNKKVVRNIGKKIYNGSETWTAGAVTSRFLNYEITDAIKDTSVDYEPSVLCDYFRAIPWSDYQTDKDTSIYIYVASGNASNNAIVITKVGETSESFKQWLQENNIIVYYPINQTEEEIELPNIPTFKGTTIIEVDTETQPSNMEVVYIGK